MQNVISEDKEDEKRGLIEEDMLPAEVETEKVNVVNLVVTPCYKHTHAHTCHHQCLSGRS